MGLEVECDPEGENGEAKEAAGEDGEELGLVGVLVGCVGRLLVVMVEMGIGRRTYKGKVPVIPDLHVDHSIWVFDLPYDESRDEDKT